jgi:hypothetical protein
MKCHTNGNYISSTQLPHKFSYIVAILGHNHFESPNNISIEGFFAQVQLNIPPETKTDCETKKHPICDYYKEFSALHF